MRAIRLGMFCALIGCLSGCVTPVVSQRSQTDLRAFKTIAYSIVTAPDAGFDSDRGIGEAEIALFDSRLEKRLENMGYQVVKSDLAPALHLFIIVTEARLGSPAARFFVSAGAGRSTFKFDAKFVDSRGDSVGAFSGGYSYTGTDLATRNADDYDIQHATVAIAISQITDFIVGETPKALGH